MTMSELAETHQCSLDVASIQDKIVARQFDAALRELATALDTHPDNMDALYMSAVCHRYKRNFDVALDLLGRLKILAPENGRAHQEEGHAYRDMGKADLALAAYARACRYNPALVASWKGWLDILSRKGRKQQAEAVAANLESLQELPPPLLGVMDLIAQGKLLRAEDLCRRFLQKVPHHTEGMRLLADIGLRLGVLDDAEFLLQSALKLEPDNSRVHIDYIQVLRKRQKFAQALEQAQQLLAKNPQNLQFQSLFAIECMQTGDYDTALEVFDKILGQLPADPVTHTSKGHAYKTLGRYEDAVDAYHGAIGTLRIMARPTIPWPISRCTHSPIAKLRRCSSRRPITTCRTWIAYTCNSHLEKPMRTGPSSRLPFAITQAAMHSRSR